jgi:hypothetical protein
MVDRLEHDLLAVDEDPAGAGLVEAAEDLDEAAAVMARASSALLASGFSQRTCLPASRAAIEISAWLDPGVQTSTRSTSSRSTSRFQSVSQAAQPSRPAAAATCSRSRPQMAARRGVKGSSKKRPTLRQAWECARPMNA